MSLHHVVPWPSFWVDGKGFVGELIDVFLDPWILHLSLAKDDCLNFKVKGICSAMVFLGVVRLACWSLKAMKWSNDWLSIYIMKRVIRGSGSKWLDFHGVVAIPAIFASKEKQGAFFGIRNPGSWILIKIDSPSESMKGYRFDCKTFIDTPPKIYIEPENDGLGRCFSFPRGVFSGSMLVFLGRSWIPCLFVQMGGVTRWIAALPRSMRCFIGTHQAAKKKYRSKIILPL